MYSFTRRKFKTDFNSKVNAYLRAVFLEINHWLEHRYGEESEKALIYITSTIRDTGIHKTGRALDFDWGVDAVDLAMVYELENHINKNFPYGKGRFKTFLPHSSRGNLEKMPDIINDPDFHIHLQVRAI